MWFKSIIDFLLGQGLAGIAILCLGYATVLFYKENQKMRKENALERTQTTEKFVALSNKTIAYIQENTNSLKELRDDIKEERHSRDATNAQMMSAFQEAIRDYRSRPNNG